MTFPVLVALVVLVVTVVLTPVAVGNARQIRRDANQIVGAGDGGHTAMRAAPAPTPTLPDKIRAANEWHRTKYRDSDGYHRDAERRPVTVRLIPTDIGHRPYDGARDCPGFYSGLSG